jgi:hypothetical protein
VRRSYDVARRRGDEEGEKVREGSRSRRATRLPWTGMTVAQADGGRCRCAIFFSRPPIDRARLLSGGEAGASSRKLEPLGARYDLQRF